MFAVDACTWAVLLGDAAGSGPAAAPLARFAHERIRASIRRGDSPASALRKANRLLLNGWREGIPLTTAVLGFARSTASGIDLEIASAGHVPPLILRSDRIQVPRVGGPLLGVMYDIELRAASVQLGRGDALVLYTDGVTEARDAAGSMLGVEGLIHGLHRVRTHPAARVAATVEAVALRHGGDAPRDDVSVLVAAA